MIDPSMTVPSLEFGSTFWCSELGKVPTERYSVACMRFRLESRDLIVGGVDHQRSAFSSSYVLRYMLPQLLYINHRLKLTIPRTLSLNGSCRR